MATSGNRRGGEKTGGRKAGTPNKTSKELREMILELVKGRWEDFLVAFDAIDDPVDKCKVFEGLLPFIAPKMASVEYKDKTPVKTLKDELDEISGEKTRG